MELINVRVNPKSFSQYRRAYLVGREREGPHGKDDAVRDDLCEGSYGPWVVVACRKKETKFQRSSGSLPDHGLTFGQRSNGQQIVTRRDWAGVGKDVDSNRLNRETKRKLSPLRILDKAQVEQVIHRLGKQAQSGSAQGAGLKAKGPKSDKARKVNSVKGMKAVARAKAGHTSLSCAAAEEKKKDCAEMRSKVSSAPVHLMGQADAVAVSGIGQVVVAEMGQVAVSHISTPLPEGKFRFAAVDVSERGQARREDTRVYSGDRSGREVSNLNWEYGLGQHKD